MTELGDFSSLLIVNCVFNVFLCYTSIMLNIVTIQALRKTPSLPMTLKTLLLSLAVSDLGVGLLVQPLYIALLAMIIGENNETKPYKIFEQIFLITANRFFYASSLGVMALAADRFLAIHLHLSYQELVTRKRVVAVVISLWIFSVILSFLDVSWIIPRKEKFISCLTIGMVCIVTTAIFSWKIYLSVRHHTTHIRRLQVHQAEQDGNVMENAARQWKFAVGAFYVFLVLLACYLPVLCLNIANLSSGLQSTLIKHLFLYAYTLVFLNSSLNPLIYSWKMRHIRQTIVNLLRNLLQGH